jgi:hypothetical protein
VLKRNFTCEPNEPGSQKFRKSYASLTQVAPRGHVGGNGGRNLRERGRSAWEAGNPSSSTNVAFTRISSVWIGSSAGEILVFIESLQTNAQVPPNEEKF